jgi:hypothetical protein
MTMPDGQTPDQHDDFGREPGSHAARGAEGAERAQEERAGHVTADPDVNAPASTTGLPHGAEPADRTPLRQRFGAESGDRR